MSEAQEPHHELEATGPLDPTAAAPSPLQHTANSTDQPHDRPSALQSIFLNTEGPQPVLRPGWSLLIFFALLAAIGALAGFTIHHLHPAAQESAAAARTKPMTPHRTILSEGIAFAALALVTWIMGRIDRRPVGTYGFGGKAKARPFFTGLAWGFGFLTLLVLALHGLGLLDFTGQQIFGVAALRSGLEWAFAFLLVGLLEEYLLRGYLQYTLARALAGLYSLLFDGPHHQALGFWTSALILSFIFGFGHTSNPGESPIGLLSAGLIGLIFCLTLWRTGSLWWAVGLHASWDWAQSYVYGVADSGLMAQGHLLGTHPAGRVLFSGGATGPEGSLLVLPLLAIITAVVLWTLPIQQHSLAAKPFDAPTAGL